MPKTASPLVSIVVLNWNGLADTLACLESLKKLTYDNYEVVVIDNGSSDGSVETLSKLSDIVFVPLPKNTGFTGGHIEGLKHSSGSYVALLNNDLIVKPDWLSELVNTALQEKADIAGGRQYQWTEDQQALDESNGYSSYQTVDLVTGHTVTLHRGERVTEANNLSGSNLLVSKRAIEKIGYLDDDFFAYYEETDLVARAKRAGIKAIYVPTAKVWHKSGASTKSQPYFYFYQMHRNRFWFAVKNYDLPYLMRFFAFYTRELLVAMRNNRRAPNLHDKAMLRAYFRNIFYLPALLMKRAKTMRLGKSYSQQLIRPTEGFDDVTVIVPCYNYGAYVTEALDSLEAQALRPTRVIVINDGSTDDSAEVIKKYIAEAQKRKSSITYDFIDQKNSGIIKTKNLALELVDTTWMMFLDADDILKPTYIEECIRSARLHRSDVVYTDMEMFGAVSTLHRTAKYNKMLLRSVNFVHNSALMKTDLFKRSGGYKQKMSIGFEDWELYLTLSELTNRFFYINKPLFLYRRHEGASRDVSAQTKMPKVIKYLEELHPKLYRLPYYWWLESYRTKTHVVEIIKFLPRLLKHTYYHTVMHAMANPKKPLPKMILALRTALKRRRM